MISKKTGKKGLETEEVVRAYFLEAGFFVVRGVKLRNHGDDLTDIDLWLYERSATLARRRIILDIKDNAQPKAAERLFFVKGLAQFIGVEAAGIVTSDSRKSLRETARKHSLLWIDNADLQRLKTSQKLAMKSRLSDEGLDRLISQVDSVRISRNLRDAYISVKSSVADRFGPSSANTAIDGFSFFARIGLQAHPNSTAAQIILRLSYFSAAIAAAALDFTSGDSALRPANERLASLIAAIRFGEDQSGTEEKLRWAQAAIREFAPNGTGLAEIVREQFNEALGSVPAEGLAEVVVKMTSSDRLFSAAKDLEAAAFSSDLVPFDKLTVDARSFLGALADFVEVDRARYSAIWEGGKGIKQKVAFENGAESASEEAARLFDDPT